MKETGIEAGVEKTQMRRTEHREPREKMSEKRDKGCMPRFWMTDRRLTSSIVLLSRILSHFKPSILSTPFQPSGQR